MEKVFPHSIEAEEGVIGSVMIDPEAMAQVRTLKAEDFYRAAHGTIWRAMLHLRSEGTPVDLITLIQRLEDTGTLDEVGGKGYVSSLVNAVPTSANIEYYADIVERCAMRRRLIHAGSKLVAHAYNDSAEDEQGFRSQILKFVTDALERTNAGRVRSLSEVLDELLLETNNRMEGDLAVHLLMTGVSTIDDAVTGMEAGNLILLAARPRMGKSALGQEIFTNISRQLAKQKATSDYITLEMSGLQQARRMVSSLGHINTQSIRTGFRDLTGRLREADDRQWGYFCKVVEQLRSEIGETAFIAEDPMTVEQLRDHLREVVASRNCRFCLVDQLDLFMDDEHRTEQEQVAHISKVLKTTARELGITIICLVQLNRSLESRPGLLGKVPNLSDLRYSGRLEQDADQVWFLHRPCIYQEQMPGFAYWSEYCEIHFAKMRDQASAAKGVLRFLPDFTAFEEWPEHWPLPTIEH